jgi:two-component system KDP operon response regulator KdpE
VTAGRRVLICDDELHILRALKVVLRDAGFDPVATANVQEALDAASVRPPDAAIIDLMLPDGHGVDIVRALREWSAMPIIVLSALGEEDDKVQALEAGADDYVTKPFGARELVARLNAALRRAGTGSDEPTIELDGLERDVRRDGKSIHLSPIEFDLLRVLARNRGRLLTHRQLLTEVWGPEYASDTQVLRTTIGRLRGKIEREASNPQYIHTDPGIGYRLAA